MSGNTMTVQNFTNSIYILGFCARAKYPMLNYLPSWHFATARWYVLEKKFVNLCFLSKQVKNFSNKNKVNNSKRNYAGAVCWCVFDCLEFWDGLKTITASLLHDHSLTKYELLFWLWVCLYLKKEKKLCRTWKKNDL